MGLFSNLFDTTSEVEGRSDAQPWAPAVPGLFKGVNLVTDAMKTPMEFFPDQTYAPQTAAELQAIDQLKAGAGAYPGMLAGYMDPATSAWQGAMGAPDQALGMGLQDVMSNPALTGAAEAIQARVNRNLQENVLPGLTEQFMGYGGIGGTRQGVAEGLAAGRTSDTLAEQLAGMYGNAWAQGLGAETSRYNAGLAARSGALSQLPGMVNLGASAYTQPAAMLEQAGARERAEGQRGIDEEMARFQFSQMEPYSRAGLGMGLLMDPGMAFGSRTQQGTTTSQPSAFGRIGQLGSLGGSILGVGFGGPTGGGLSGLFGGGLGGGLGGGSYMAPGMPFGQYNNPWTSGGAGWYG